MRKAAQLEESHLNDEEDQEEETLALDDTTHVKSSSHVDSNSNVGQLDSAIFGKTSSVEGEIDIENQDGKEDENVCHVNFLMITC